MSYCRFSSDNWRSDVYCYEAEEGYVIHVAKYRKVIQPIPDLVGTWFWYWVGDCEWEWVKRFGYRLISWWHNQIHARSLRLIPLRPIHLPKDGETFGYDSAKDCFNRLLALRGIGYYIPQSAIESLREEIE